MFFGGEYNEERDGPLERYFETHDGFSTFPLFRGPSIYERIWNEGYIIPRFTWLRLMWNLGRDDEHFAILEDGGLEGISHAPAHAGRPGNYEYTDIIFDNPNTPCFELGNLKTWERVLPKIRLGE